MSTILLGTPLPSLRPTLHNGPGWRVAMWTQGCSLRCTRNCLNPRFLSNSGGTRYAVEAVTDRLRQLMREAVHPIEGVTVLGGEPTDQPEGLVETLEGVRSLGLSTMVYTGHAAEQLEAVLGPVAGRFFDAVDLLVDGPFVDDARDETLAWRGSSNQRLLCISTRYTPHGLQEAFTRQGKGFSIVVSADGRFSASGLQDRGTAAAIERFVAGRTR